MRRRVDIRFPQYAAVLRVEGAEFRVERGADEDDTSSGRNGAAHVRCAGVLHALFLRFGKTAERHSPCDRAGVGVDRDELAPRRVLTRPLRFRIPETETGGTAFAERC